jgi:hypothetical protein
MEEKFESPLLLSGITLILHHNVSSVDEEILALGIDKYDVEMYRRKHYRSEFWQIQSNSLNSL